MVKVINVALLNMAKRDTFRLNGCAFSAAEEEKYLKEEADCINMQPPGVIPVTFSKPGFPMNVSPDMLIIDMRGLYFFTIN
jgi:hypothetical protein